ncbi:MAG: 2,3-bisphosphoglycerate-independent phosphoglycerate mutase [Acidobacteria bacterium]|nr:MAG: 2,3-bisphosphoglycerate-independent phosphoglycerate mutase [Acidobacteriota bacterium]
MKIPKPVVLVILDGWGYRAERENNAIALAKTPNYTALLKEYPSTLVYTSGERVGLPEGLMGNSEVGHLNIGAGRIVYQDITRIDAAIRTGEFFKNPALLQLMEAGRKTRLHFMGLLSDGGVHSHQRHLYSLLKMARENRVSEVFVHVFLDGRDTAPTNGAGYVEALQRQMREYNIGRVATISGRYYAMDRDNRWQRTQLAYDAIVNGEGVKAEDPVAAIKNSYNQGVTDEFVVPIVITDSQGHPTATIRGDDAVMFFNFRADRARQMTRALTQPDLQGFQRRGYPEKLHYLSMTRYDKTFTNPYVFSPQSLTHILAAVMADAQLTNLRVAETEKYAHVTYFFNGGVEKAYPGEDRILVPSPKVATYDLQPEMSARGVMDTVVKAVNEGSRDVIIVNFANADMVGHTGKLEAAVKAVETVDVCLGEVYKAVRAKGGAMVITADHGNAELMVDPVTGGPHTAHTTNPVPLILVAEQVPPKLREGGALADVSPTLLGLLGIPLPPEMTGHDLRDAEFKGLSTQPGR